MTLTLAFVGPRSSSARSQSGVKAGVKPHCDALTRMYLDRVQTYFPCQLEAFASEKAFLAWLARPAGASRGKAGRTPVSAVLLDGSRGRQLTSLEIASWLGARRDQGAQHIAFAIGPPDGWSAEALESARSGSLALSFGPITMAHDLARVVLAEQLYRACTILAGHPYHCGH